MRKQKRRGGEGEREEIREGRDEDKEKGELEEKVRRGRTRPPSTGGHIMHKRAGL